ncbi:MAG: thioredoxin family protein [Bacilli bacterium]
MKNKIETLLHKDNSFFLYVYAPLCGTCHVAEKMVTVVEEIIGQEVERMDANYMEKQLFAWEVESVPCLLLIANGKVQRRMYRFESVPNVLAFVQS